MNPPEFNLMPPKVRAALAYLHYCTRSNLTDLLCADEDGPLLPPKKHESMSLEAVVKAAALEVLRLYLTGEMEFAPGPPRRTRAKKVSTDPEPEDL